MSATDVAGSQWVLVSDEQQVADDGARLKAWREGIEETIDAVAKQAGITPKQLGRIESGKASPRGTTVRKIERALRDLEAESGFHGKPATAYATTEGQVTIVAEGVFGVARLTVSGSPGDAEASMAKLIEDIRRGDAENGPEHG